jgi:hypothetical protein
MRSLIWRIDNYTSSTLPWLWRLKPHIGLLVLATASAFGLLFQLVDAQVSDRLLFPLPSPLDRIYVPMIVPIIFVSLLLGGWFVSIAQAPGLEAFPHLSHRPGLVYMTMSCGVTFGALWLAWVCRLRRGVCSRWS